MQTFIIYNKYSEYSEMRWQCHKSNIIMVYYKSFPYVSFMTALLALDFYWTLSLYTCDGKYQQDIGVAKCIHCVSHFSPQRPK